MTVLVNQKSMKLVWVDLETTGLIPEEDVILEAAFAEADLHSPFDIGPITSFVLGFKAVTLNPFIVKMHTRNGLLLECAESKLSIVDVARHLQTILPVVEDKDDRTTFAGSTVSFDKSFLEFAFERNYEMNYEEHASEELRKLLTYDEKRLSYRTYDVSALKLICRSMGMEKIPKAEAHRAKDDILESVEHGKLCFNWIRKTRAGLFQLE